MWIYRNTGMYIFIEKKTGIIEKEHKCKYRYNSAQIIAIITLSRSKITAPCSIIRCCTYTYFVNISNYIIDIELYTPTNIHEQSNIHVYTCIYSKPTLSQYIYIHVYLVTFSFPSLLNAVCTLTMPSLWYSSNSLW